MQEVIFEQGNIDLKTQRKMDSSQESKLNKIVQIQDLFQHLHLELFFFIVDSILVGFKENSLFQIT